ncbi:UPF0488 protein C8orf33 homolog [Paroedura picta]|uniref:UPF0488 protein C8orf33 homolog n=1 Tax=Paroedura picta TaxID=143630 RepID=UPI004055C327
MKSVCSSLIQAPKGSFQDELEWCISQLETGLLHLHPTPEQAEESQRILRVLRSRKAPSVKKQQVMHRVFGDYRLKMAEERERGAKAAVESEKVQIQPGDVSGSGSVAYRRQCGNPSEAPSWFAPSDNSFQFGFDLPGRAAEEIQGTPEAANGAADDAQEQLASNTPSAPEGQAEMLCFPTGMQGPEFAFNFSIPDGLLPPAAAADPSLEDAAGAATEKVMISRKATEMLEGSGSLKASSLDAGSGGEEREDENPARESAQEAATEEKETAHQEGTAAAAGGSSKRKKRKKRPSKAEPSKNPDSRLHVKAASDQPEVCQQPQEQVKREVEWCVEQLELGLKMQKATPKQTEEALRAIKTLRSEKAVLAKKRQIMRLMFGDYRKKMAEERQKQLKLMQAASKAARITKVTEDARRKSSQVFGKSLEVAGKIQNPKAPVLHLPGTADACSFRFTPSQEEFRFDFF